MSMNFILDLFLICPDISQTRAAGPAQPILKTLPHTQHGQGRTRAFSSSWYEAYTGWILCAEIGLFVCACRHFSLSSAPETTFNSANGFSNWKKAMYKDGYSGLHAKAEHHLNAFKEVFYEMFSTVFLHWKLEKKSLALRNLGVPSVESKRAKAFDMDEFVRLFSSKHGTINNYFLYY